MTRTKIAIGLAAAMIGFASGASAQLRYPPGAQPGPGAGPMRGHGPMPGPQRYGRGPGAGYRAPPMAMPEYRRFNRGERLPPQYRSNQYIVNDWRGHHLSAPPRGYYWLQNGSDYVLAAIATGVIASVVVNALSQ